MAKKPVYPPRLRGAQCVCLDQDCGSCLSVCTGVRGDMVGGRAWIWLEHCHPSWGCRRKESTDHPGWSCISTPCTLLAFQLVGLVGVQDIVWGWEFAGHEFAISGLSAQWLLSLMGVTVLPALSCAECQGITSSGWPLAKAKEGGHASLFCSFLYVDWRGGWEWAGQVGHGEIPERLIDLVKKNKGIQSPAPPFSTWACGLRRSLWSLAVRRSKKKFSMIPDCLGQI